jgi:alcohol dehydrogenase class IV
MQHASGELGAAYDFAVPPLIRFGSGRIAEIGDLVGLWGREAWIVAGGRSFAASGARERVDAALATAGIPGRMVAAAAGEPTVDQVTEALAGLPRRSLAGVVVVAVGGGSTIDLAKAVAAMAVLLPDVPADRGAIDALVVDHLEGVGRGLSIRRWPLPLVAVPTTAGTGAEATRNAVLSCPRRGFKKSMRSPMMVPRAAVVDPELTASCSRDTVIASGLDCITQLVESFVCRFGQPLPRALVLEALPRAVEALPRLVDPRPAAEGGDGLAADRAAMSHAALVSGIALANSGLGLAHGVAAALGIACGVPHGLACATMLPAAMRVNRAAAGHEFALLERAIDPAASPDDADAADAFVARIDRLCAAAPRRLSEIGVRADHLGWIAENSGGNSMRGNPVQLDAASLHRLLADML